MRPNNIKKEGMEDFLKRKDDPALERLRKELMDDGAKPQSYTQGDATQPKFENREDLEKFINK